LNTRNVNVIFPYLIVFEKKYIYQEILIFINERIKGSNAKQYKLEELTSAPGILENVKSLKRYKMISGGCSPS